MTYDAEWNIRLAVIRSFRDKEAQKLFEGEDVPRFRSLSKLILRKLDMIVAARQVGDLRSPPGNQLKALSGTRRGQYSISINDQWRICFVWRDGAEDVEIVDYH